MNFAHHTLAFISLPGGMEWVVLLVIGLLIFGRRLPEVGRSVGRSIVEFKRGIKDIQDDVEEESNKPPKRIADDSANPPADYALGAGEKKVEATHES